MTFCIECSRGKFLATVQTESTALAFSDIKWSKTPVQRSSSFFVDRYQLHVPSLWDAARSFLMNILSLAHTLDHRRRFRSVAMMDRKYVLMLSKYADSNREENGPRSAAAMKEAKKWRERGKFCSFLDFNDIPSVLVTLQWIVTNEIRMKK